MPLLFCGRSLLQSVALGLIHSRQVDHELGELGGIAGTFWALVRHGTSMQGAPSRCQRTIGPALFKGAHYPDSTSVDKNQHLIYYQSS
jgi:hypothetical protein